MLKYIAYAGVAYAAYQIVRAMRPQQIEGADLARQETPLVGYNPATSAPSTFGAGTAWASATAQYYDAYAPQYHWAPASQGYGWNGDFYPVNAR